MNKSMGNHEHSWKLVALYKNMYKTIYNKKKEDGEDEDEDGELLMF